MKFVAYLLVMGFTVPMSAAFGDSIQTFCQVTQVNQSVNNHLFEEGLVECSDESGDADSVEVGYGSLRARNLEFSVGQMKYQNGRNASVSLRSHPGDDALIFMIEPYGAEFLLAAHIVEGGTGFVWYQLRGAPVNFQLLTRFDCSRRCPPRY